VVGQSFYNGCLANSGLANETGIVLGAPAEDLNDSLDLLFASNNRVQLSLASRIGQVNANLVQGRGLRGGTDASMRLRRALTQYAHRLGTHLVEADSHAF